MPVDVPALAELLADPLELALGAAELLLGLLGLVLGALELVLELHAASSKAALVAANAMTGADMRPVKRGLLLIRSPFPVVFATHRASTRRILWLN
jgi:hypothetical protein